MQVLAIIVFLCVAVSCQTIEDGWKNIKPLHTNRSMVDKLLGASKESPPLDTIYRNDEAFVRITYTVEPCTEDNFRRGKFNVPKGTVLEYYLRIKKDIKLGDFDYKREKYKKDTSGDIVNIVQYRNVEDGITLDAYIQQGVEYLSAIRIGPSKKDAEKFKCAELKPPA